MQRMILLIMYLCMTLKVIHKRTSLSKLVHMCIQSMMTSILSSEKRYTNIWTANWYCGRISPIPVLLVLFMVDLRMIFFSYTTTDYLTWGVGHYNGTDFKTIYTLPLDMRMSGVMLFEKDIFVPCYSSSSNGVIVLHGQLSTKKWRPSHRMQYIKKTRMMWCWS